MKLDIYSYTNNIFVEDSSSILVPTETKKKSIHEVTLEVLYTRCLMAISIPEGLL